VKDVSNIAAVQLKNDLFDVFLPV